jgi:hydroxymethylpyrimidine pyrophosphatase-like HAD family hydrolase
MVNGKLVLAIDFDGTIATLSFPEVGGLRKDAAVIIRRLYSDGHYIIINTCRSGRYQGMAEDFLKENSIPYHFVNCNLPELIVEYDSDCRKISADWYIDDKGIGGLPSWEEIYDIIQDNLFKE